MSSVISRIISYNANKIAYKTQHNANYYIINNSFKSINKFNQQYTRYYYNNHHNNSNDNNSNYNNSNNYNSHNYYNYTFGSVFLSGICIITLQSNSNSNSSKPLAIRIHESIFGPLDSDQTSALHAHDILSDYFIKKSKLDLPIKPAYPIIDNNQINIIKQLNQLLDQQNYKIFDETVKAQLDSNMSNKNESGIGYRVELLRLYATSLCERNNFSASNELYNKALQLQLNNLQNITPDNTVPNNIRLFNSILITLTMQLQDINVTRKNNKNVATSGVIENILMLYNNYNKSRDMLNITNENTGKIELFLFRLSMLLNEYGLSEQANTIGNKLFKNLPNEIIHKLTKLSPNDHK